MQQDMDSTAERLMAQLEEVDDAISARLGIVFSRRRCITAAELRETIVTWCSSAEARALYNREALDGAAYALGAMEDDVLLPLVRDLLRRGRSRPQASVA